MDVELDPNEVLVHLNQMGYHNISQVQLQEFIKDLKKLILYEERKQSGGSGSTLSSSMSPEEVHYHRKSHKPSCPRRKYEGNNSKDADISSSSSSTSGQVLRIPIQKQHTTDEHSKSSARDQRSVLKSRENLASHRSKSSFIRPRDLTSQRPGSAPQKSDPVALYHHYKQLWKQQKLPGEEPHSGLRWTIREKMMGQEPRQRVEQCGCCCKCDCLENCTDDKEFIEKVHPDNIASESNSRETLRIRGPYTLDGRITGFKNGKTKERTVLGTFEIYDRVRKSVNDCCTKPRVGSGSESHYKEKQSYREWFHSDVPDVSRVEKHGEKERRDKLKSKNNRNSEDGSNDRVHSSTLKDHVRNLLHMEKEFPLDLISRNERTKKLRDQDERTGKNVLKQLDISARIRKVTDDFFKKGYKIVDEKHRKNRDSVNDALQTNQKEETSIKCRHTTVCNCNEDEITYVTLKSDKSKGNKKIVISTEISRHK